MDFLWSPWRYQYISSINSADQCVFCIKSSTEDDESRLILFRGEVTFVILNRFPYTSGHLLITPYQHISDFSDCSSGQMSEMMELAQRSKSAIEQVYHPDGFNLGMNMGKCAGAGVAHHIHLHLVPRWIGDANFMTIIGESRVLPESLEATYQKLKPYF